MDKEKTKQFVNSTWDQSIVPALEEYIRIPNQSPAVIFFFYFFLKL